MHSSCHSVFSCLLINYNSLQFCDHCANRRQKKSMYVTEASYRPGTVAEVVRSDTPSTARYTSHGRGGRRRRSWCGEIFERRGSCRIADGIRVGRQSTRRLHQLSGCGENTNNGVSFSQVGRWVCLNKRLRVDENWRRGREGRGSPALSSRIGQSIPANIHLHVGMLSSKSEKSCCI